MNGSTVIFVLPSQKIYRIIAISKIIFVPIFLILSFINIKDTYFVLWLIDSDQVSVKNILCDNFQNQSFIFYTTQI